MDIFRITVKKEVRDLYSPSFLHDNYCFIVDETDDHLYVKSLRKDYHGVCYISSIERYVKSDIEVSKINENEIY